MGKFTALEQLKRIIGHDDATSEGYRLPSSLRREIEQTIARESQPAIQVEGRRWFDRVNGNTYHTVKIWVGGEQVYISPISYGYDDHYLQTAKDALHSGGLLPGIENGTPLWRYCEERGIKLIKSVTDGLKRELHKAVS